MNINKTRYVNKGFKRIVTGSNGEQAI